MILRRGAGRFLTIDGYDDAAGSDKHTNESSSLCDTPADPELGEARYIDATVRAYLRAGVPVAKFTMGLPLYAVGWKGVPNENPACIRTQPALLLYFWPTVRVYVRTRRKPQRRPGCDTILTPGFSAYSTIENLTNKYGHVPWYDSARIGTTLYNRSNTSFNRM